MLRKSLLINFVFGVVSAVLIAAFVPSPAGIANAVRTAASSFALNNALLHPIVFRNILK